MRPLNYYFLPSLAAAQGVLNLDVRFPSLTLLQQIINSSPRVTTLLQQARNFTFLAPSNEALSSWVLQKNRTQDEIDAILSYHLIAGDQPSILFNQEPDFLATSLLNASYANVTGGQRVGGYMDKNVVFVSKNKTLSNVISKDNLVLHGIVHIIDNVLQIPSDLITTAIDASWSYALAYLSHGLNRAPQIYNFTSSVKPLSVSDITFFLPNSAFALDRLNDNDNDTVTTEQFLQNTLYHLYSGVIYSPALKDGLKLYMASGHPAVITVLANGTKYINAARITATDYLVDNGVVHILEDFLTPGDTAGPAIPSSSPAPSAAQPSSSSDTKKLPTAAYAGIGAGALLILFIAVVSVIIWLKRRQQRRNGEKVESRQGSRKIELACGNEQPLEMWQYPVELKANNGSYEVTELETREFAVELDARENIEMDPTRRIGLAF